MTSLPRPPRADLTRAELRVAHHCTPRFGPARGRTPASAREQLSREPRTLPVMRLNQAVKNIHEFRYEDFELAGYDPHPAIKAPIAV